MAGEVGGGFGAPVAEEAVGVFDAAFLVWGVGVGVIDGGVEDLFEEGLVEELAAPLSVVTERMVWRAFSRMSRRRLRAMAFCEMWLILRMM